MSTYTRLPDAELEVMKVLWQLNRPATRAEIECALKEEQNWAAQTILSMLSRLEAKGFVRSERAGKANLYHATVQREHYLKSESKTMLDKLFGGSPKAFMAALLQNDTMSDTDISELEDYLREARRNTD